jgi:AAA domain
MTGERPLFADVVAKRGSETNGEGSVIPDDGLLLQASSITPRNVSFLKFPEIPFATLTVVVGEGDRGKSTLVVSHVARSTRGQLAGDVEGFPIDVVIATAEDGHEEIMVRRLKAAGADMDRVHLLVLDDGFEIPDDLPRLERQIERVGARLLVIDPLIAFLPTRLDSHKDQHARNALAPLAAIASRHELAVESVMHVNKGEASELFRRVGSSGGFFNAARSVLLVAKDPQDEAVRVVAHGKHNWSIQARSTKFKIESFELEDVDLRTGKRITTTRFVSCGHSDLTIADLLQTDHRADPRRRATAWLENQLADGPVWVEDFKRAAKAASHSWMTVRRAQEDLGIEPYPDGFQGPSMWSLEGKPEPKDAQAPSQRRSEQLWGLDGA